MDELASFDDARIELLQTVKPILEHLRKAQTNLDDQLIALSAIAKVLESISA